MEERRKPADRPRIGGRRPCPPTEGLGKAKNKSSSVIGGGHKQIDLYRP